MPKKISKKSLMDKQIPGHDVPHSLLPLQENKGRIILILMAFFSGAALMIIELCANRILAPWFGNSLYTWTGLIGIILVAMSFGYYLGGWLVDRKPNFVTLSHLLLASAFFTLLIPFLQAAIEDLFSQADLVWGPVLASLILFTIPGCLLGSVSPFAIRLTSLLYQDKRIGISAGSIGMFSTLGSVLGTFGAGFILIPQMGVKTIFFLIAVILASLAMPGYVMISSLSKKQGKALFFFSIFLIILSLSFSLHGSSLPPHLLFDQTTFYHRIRVVQQSLPNGDLEKTLLLDTTVEGAQYEKSRDIPIPYQRYWELIKVFHPEVRKVAFLGAGAYTMPISLLKDYPHAEVDVVEIDPKVVEVGRLFFHLNEYPQISPIVDDARRYLYRSNKKYDFIFGDAFNGLRYIPAHLVTLEFFRLVKNRLSDKGVYMMNIVSAINGEHSHLFLAVNNTLKRVFKNNYVFALYPQHLRTVQNLIIVASNQSLRMEIDSNKTGLEKIRLEGLLATYVPDQLYSTSNDSLLSDNFNPVEYIVARGLR
ncbi:MAG: fused MFS/spermidine synthase [Deltaproteobacteria bacterium]|nr:fused MFS/spermidine synthase [Deltaproteobacteria bacterium]